MGGRSQPWEGRKPPKDRAGEEEAAAQGGERLDGASGAKQGRGRSQLGGWRAANSVQPLRPIFLPTQATTNRTENRLG